MKNTIAAAIALLACPLFAQAQTKLAGKIFKPISIELNGSKKILSSDSIPFAMEFIDEKNVVYRELKSNYYVLHHCVYSVRNNSLSIEFLRKTHPPMVWQILASDDRNLELKNEASTIHLSKTAD